MSEKDENKVVNNSGEQQIEKNFYETKLGKIMKVVEIIGCILTILGLALAIFEAIVHAKNLEDKYQSIIEFGNSAIKYGLICFFANSITRIEYDAKKVNKKEIKE